MRQRARDVNDILLARQRAPEPPRSTLDGWSGLRRIQAEDDEARRQRVEGNLQALLDSVEQEQENMRARRPRYSVQTRPIYPVYIDNDGEQGGGANGAHDGGRDRDVVVQLRRYMEHGPDDSSSSVQAPAEPFRPSILPLPLIQLNPASATRSSSSNSIHGKKRTVVQTRGPDPPTKQARLSKDYFYAGR